MTCISQDEPDSKTPAGKQVAGEIFDFKSIPYDRIAETNDPREQIKAKLVQRSEVDADATWDDGVVAAHGEDGQRWNCFPSCWNLSPV